MTYAPDPADVSNWLAEPAPRPRSVAAAVRLIYAVAALEILGVIISVARIGTLTGAIEAADRFTVSEAHSVALHDTRVTAASGLINAGLWLWVARHNAAGRTWARVVATALFVLHSLGVLLIVLPGHSTSFGAILDVMTWLVALGAVICLWRRDASQYFHSAAPHLARPRYF